MKGSRSSGRSGRMDPLRTLADGERFVTEHVDLLSSVGICISVAAALAFIGNWLRQPLLLAYLLAGVLIGPQIGLGLISDQASIETVSEIGLILLLFIIGLELDLNKLLAAGKPVLVTGILQFPLCVALGLAFFIPFGFRMSGGDFGLLYLAVCLAISSTMIVVKLLYDKFELDTLPGRITLGVLIFQDIWAIIVLGIQPNLLDPQFGKLLGSLGSGVLLVAVTLVISKTLLPRLFRSVAKLPELVLIGSLAWCFIVCAAANAAGLSREMGALIAGIAISDFSVQPRRGGQGRQHPRFLRDAVLRGARHADPDAHTRAHRNGVARVGVPGRQPIRRGLPDPSHAAARAPGQPAARDQPRADERVLDGDRRDRARLPAYRRENGQPADFRIRVHVGRFDVPDRVQPSAAGTAGGVAAQDRASRISTKALPAAPRHARWPARTWCCSASSPKRARWCTSTRWRGIRCLRGCSSSTSIPMCTRSSTRRGIACKYGDVASMQTLHHAEVHDAKLVVSTIPDTILKGTSNLRLLQQARRLCPHAKVVVTANRAASALELYDAGADFVFVSRLHSAAQMASILEQGLAHGFDRLREEQIAHIRQRDEVLK